MWELPSNDTDPMARSATSAEHAILKLRTYKQQHPPSRSPPLSCHSQGRPTAHPHPLSPQPPPRSPGPSRGGTRSERADLQDATAVSPPCLITPP